MQTLSSESPDENAKQLVDWMEQGVFKALNAGYLVRPCHQRPCAKHTHKRARAVGSASRGRTSACLSSLPMRKRR